MARESLRAPLQKAAKEGEMKMARKPKNEGGEHEAPSSSAKRSSKST